MRDLYWQSDAWLEYGKVELLKGNMSRYASVRIDKKNRLIFTADAGRITVIQCSGHYGDH